MKKIKTPGIPPASLPRYVQVTLQHLALSSSTSVFQGQDLVSVDMVSVDGIKGDDRSVGNTKNNSPLKMNMEAQKWRFSVFSFPSWVIFRFLFVSFLGCIPFPSLPNTWRLKVFGVGFWGPNTDPHVWCLEALGFSNGKEVVDSFWWFLLG